MNIHTILVRMTSTLVLLWTLWGAPLAFAGSPQMSRSRWQDRDFPLTFRLNVTGVPEHMRCPFLVYGYLGLMDWAGVEGSKLTACYLGETSRYEKYDETILATWQPTFPNVGGYAYYPPVGRIVYNSIYAESYFNNRDALRNLVLHENGHAIGFPHYFEEESVMAYKFIPQLTSFDVALIQLNYPGEKGGQ